MSKLRFFFLFLVAALVLAGCDTGQLAGGSDLAPSEPGDIRVEEPLAEGILAQYDPPAEVAQADVDASGASANSYSMYPSLNEDGSKLAFCSPATNLDGPTNNSSQAFVKNLETGQVTMVSRWAGQPANSYCSSSNISSSGDKVAFYSYASNLGFPGSTTRVFVGDTAGTIWLASSAANGAAPTSSSYRPRFGGNDFVVFDSVANNLVPGDTNPSYDVFVKQLSTGAINLVDRNSTGQQANSASYFADISNDGRYVTFFTYAFNLGGPQGFYWRDTQTGTTACASNGAYNIGTTSCISGDGNRVCFTTDSSSKLRIYDRATQTHTEQLDRNTSSFELSENGRFLVAARSDDPAVAEDTDGVSDIYVKDLDSGETALVSVDFSGHCSTPTISGDGSTIAWYANSHIYLVANPLANPQPPEPDPETYEPPVSPAVATTNVAGEMSNAGWQGVRNPRISQSGRYLAFESRATNLHPEATSSLSRIYRKDLLTGEVEIVSRQNGTNAPAEAYGYLAINADGSRVAFSSRRPDLTSIISPGTNYYTGYFRDLTAATTGLLGYKVNPSGFGGSDNIAVWTTEQLAGDDDSYNYDVFTFHPSSGSFQWVSQPPTFGPTSRTGPHLVSNDGRYSAFSDPYNSSSGGPLWLRDNQTGQVTVVTTSLYYSDFDLSGDGRTIAYRTNTRQLYIDHLDDGQPARLVVPTQAGYAKLSDDGRYALYQYTSWPVGTNSGPSGVMKVYDWDNDTSTPIDPSARFPQGVDLSGDGRTVIFEATVGSSNTQFFVQKNPAFEDEQPPAPMGPTVVSTNAQGQEANAACSSPSLSYDGQMVAFTTQATNMGVSVPAYYWNVFRKEVATGALDVVNLTPLGTYNSYDRAIISADGTKVVFGGEGYDPQFYGWGSAVWLRDLAADTIEGVSRNSGGLLYENNVRLQAFAGNDQLVFHNAVPGASYLFYRNLTSQQTSYVGLTEDFELASVSLDGKVCYRSPNQNYYLWTSQGSTNLTNLAGEGFWIPRVSHDGAFVGFTGAYYNLRPVKVYELATSAFQTLDSSSEDNTLYPPDFSADSRYRVYLKQGRVVVQDSTHEPTITTHTVSLTTGCSNPIISGDGSTIGWLYNGQVYVASNPFEN